MAKQNHDGITWTDRTWSPLKVQMSKDAPKIAREKGYTSLVQIAEKILERVEAGKHSGVGHHCERISPACGDPTGGGCYAERDNRRCRPGNGTGLPYDRRSRDLVEPFVDEKELLKPLSWRKAQYVFVENQSDLFAEWYSDEMRDQVFAVMLANAMESFNWRGHPTKATFQLLTKRSADMRRYFSERSPGELVKAWAKAGDCIIRMENEDTLFSEAVYSRTCHDWDENGTNSSKSEHAPWKYLRGLMPLHGVWLGCTTEDQHRADERIPDLMATPAALRYLSVEPMLGPLDLSRIPTGEGTGDEWSPIIHMNALKRASVLAPHIDWVICGTESGPGARHTDLAWIRDLRDQCKAAGVPFFLKQLTERGRKIPFEAWPEDLKVREMPEVRRG